MSAPNKGKQCRSKKVRKTATGRQKQVEYFNVSTFLLLVLWLVLRESALITFPVSLFGLIVPLLMFFLTVTYHARLPENERISWHPFGYRGYWHPMCNLTLILALFFIELPKINVISRVLGIVGIVAIFGVFALSFVIWLRKSK